MDDVSLDRCAVDSLEELTLARDKAALEEASRAWAKAVSARLAWLGSEHPDVRRARGLAEYASLLRYLLAHTGMLFQAFRGGGIQIVGSCGDASWLRRRLEEARQRALGEEARR